MNSKFVKTMLFAFLTVGLAVSCAPSSSGGDKPGGDTPGGDTPGGDTPGGDTPGGDTPGEETSFPVDDIKAFFAGYEIDIQNLPSYATASEKANFETDDSFEGYFDVYVNDTTSAELVAYKNALKTAGWTVVSENEETEEDFRLQYGETNAYVDLLDYIAWAEEGEAPYNLVSFFVKSESETTYYADVVAAEFNANLASVGYSFKAEWDDKYEEFYLGVSFGDSTDESETNLKNAAYELASFVPAYMLLDTEIYGDPNAEGYYDLFQDQSYYYFMGFLSPDENVMAQVISYVYNGKLVATISISGELSPAEPISINETAAEFFAAIELEFNALPDFSSLDAHVEDIDVDLTGEGGFGIYLDFYFDGDYSAEIIAILADWDEYPASFGRGFVDSTKTVSAIIASDTFGDTVLELSAYVEPDPIDWGDYGSLNGLLAAFLEAAGIEGHTAKDLSSYESYVVDWYADFEGKNYYPNFNIWVMGDKVSDITTILDGFGYVPADEASTDTFVSADGKLTVEIGYSDEYGQSYVYVMNSEDLVVAPLDDQIAAFFEALEIDIDFPSLAAYEDTYLKNYTGGDPTTGSFRIIIDGDVTEAVCALFGEGWTAGVDSWGDPLYTNADGTISVNVYASSGMTVVSIKVSAPADPLDDQIAAFFEALEIDTDFPSLAAYESTYLKDYTSGNTETGSFTIYIQGDVTEAVCALFGEGWTAGVDSWGDPLYTNTDETISVNVYVSYGITVVAIQVAIEVDPLDDQLAAFFTALEIDPDFPSFAAYDEYVDAQGTEAVLEKDFFRIVLTGDFVDEICALFGEGWTAGVDDYGDPLYTNADGTISVNVYSMYGSTIVGIQYIASDESLEDGTSETFPSDIIAKYFPDVTVPALDGASSYAYEALSIGEYANVIITASFADEDAANAAAATYIALLTSDTYGYELAFSGYDTLVDPTGGIMVDVYVDGTSVVVDIYSNEIA